MITWKSSPSAAVGISGDFFFILLKSRTGEWSLSIEGTEPPFIPWLIIPFSDMEKAKARAEKELERLEKE